MEAALPSLYTTVQNLTLGLLTDYFEEWVDQRAWFKWWGKKDVFTCTQEITPEIISDLELCVCVCVHAFFYLRPYLIQISSKRSWKDYGLGDLKHNMAVCYKNLK